MPTDIPKQENFRHIIRLLEADMKGEKKILPSLKKIKGVSFSFANAICNILDLDLKRQVGTLTDGELENITDIVKNPKKHNIPSWLFNRIKDLDTGEDKHLTGSELRLQKEFDIKHLKKIKCYRGIRHSSGLPVRGQRTRGNFRHGKTIGVRRKGMPTKKKEGATN